MTKYIIISLFLFISGSAILVYLDERTYDQISLLGYFGIALCMIGIGFIPLASLIYWIIKKIW